MRKILILFLMITAKGTFAQLLGNICPCGMQIVIDIDKFNLRKPRTECTKGFGFCVKIDKLYITCSPCEGGKTMKASLNNQKVTAYLRSDCGKLSLHLPASLEQEEMYAGESLREFEIEDGAIPLADGVTPAQYHIAGGIYPVEHIDDELVIRLNYK